MAVKTAATETQLGELHNRVASVIVNALKVVEKAQENYLISEDIDLPPPEVSAPLLSVATKFLADNKITCVPEESEKLSQLDTILQSKRNKRLNVGNVVHLAV